MSNDNRNEDEGWDGAPDIRQYRREKPLNVVKRADGSEYRNYGDGFIELWKDDKFVDKGPV